MLLGTVNVGSLEQRKGMSKV